MQPFNELGWWQWMYYLSPYTYLIEGLLGTGECRWNVFSYVYSPDCLVIGHTEIYCSAVEFVQLVPPAGQSCSSYLDPFISVIGGYLTDPSATESCAYCPFRTADQFLSNTFSIEYSHRWRDAGIFIAFIFFNVSSRSLFSATTGMLTTIVGRFLQPSPSRTYSGLAPATSSLASRSALTVLGRASNQLRSFNILSYMNTSRLWTLTL